MIIRLSPHAKIPSFVTYNYPYDGHIYQHQSNAYNEFVVIGNKRISCGVQFDITIGYRWEMNKITIE